jgi:hypothetical protein
MTQVGANTAKNGVSAIVQNCFYVLVVLEKILQESLNQRQSINLSE